MDLIKSVHRLRAAIRVIVAPANLKRTGFIAALVGVWLTAINEGDQVIHGHFGGIGLKVVMNFVTPFVVANLGLLARTDRTSVVGQSPQQGPGAATRATRVAHEPPHGAAGLEKLHDVGDSL